MFDWVPQCQNENIFFSLGAESLKSRAGHCFLMISFLILFHLCAWAYPSPSYLRYPASLHCFPRTSVLLPEDILAWVIGCYKVLEPDSLSDSLFSVIGIHFQMSWKCHLFLSFLLFFFFKPWLFVFSNLSFCHFNRVLGRNAYISLSVSRNSPLFFYSLYLILVEQNFIMTAVQTVCEP